jgi:hypothetical protein
MALQTRPLIGKRFVTCNTEVNGKRRFLRGPCHSYATKELLGEVFPVWSVPRLYNEQLRLPESLEMEVRRVGGWCEMAASLGVSHLEQQVTCETVAGQYGSEHGS